MNIEETQVYIKIGVLAHEYEELDMNHREVVEELIALLPDNKEWLYEGYSYDNVKKMIYFRFFCANYE